MYNDRSCVSQLLTPNQAFNTIDFYIIDGYGNVMGASVIILNWNATSWSERALRCDFSNAIGLFRNTPCNRGRSASSYREAKIGKKWYE